jgi:DNA repair exonuclease SbcCD ATPase subunit
MRRPLFASKENCCMDLTQLAQMVTWLDEEHRRDRAEIARLQQRIEAQSADIIEQARRIQELEGRLAGTQAQLTRFNQIEQSIQNTKTELVGLVERAYEERVAGQRELERARMSDREMLSREVSEVRRELPRIARLEESIQVRVVEDERLSELIMGVRNQIGGLAKEIEERTRQIPFLVEQRTSDTKRIAQLQQETVELFKRTEATAGRIPLLDELIRKTGQEYDKLPPQIEQLREEQVKFMERTRVMVVEREQVITRWQETIEEQKTLVQQSYERVQTFAQQIEVARRAVNEMQEFKDLILREQGQVTELQRLAEERIRREMDEFREDYEKKRRKIELRQEHLWSEQDKYNREVVERFPPLQHDIKIIESLVDQVWKAQETYGNYVLTMANSWLEGMQRTVRERDEKVRTMEEAWQRQRRNAELFASQGNQRRTPGIVTGEPPAQANGQK